MEGRSRKETVFLGSKEVLAEGIWREEVGGTGTSQAGKLRVSSAALTDSSVLKLGMAALEKSRRLEAAGGLSS